MQTPGIYLPYYRPISALSFGLNYIVSGLDPSGYHFVNLFLHASVTVLVFLNGYLLLDNSFTAFLASVFFTLHPLLIEILPVVARRQDLLMTFFLLNSFLLVQLYTRRYITGWHARLLAVGAFLLSLGSKENGILLIPLLYLYWRSRTTSKSLSSHLRTLARCTPFILVGIIFIIWRFQVLGQWGGPRAPLYLGLVKMISLIGSFYTSGYLYGLGFLTSIKGFAVLPLNLTLLVIVFFGFLGGRTFKNPTKRMKKLIYNGRWMVVPCAVVVGGFAFFDLFYLGRNDPWMLVEFILVFVVLFFVTVFFFNSLRSSDSILPDRRKNFLVGWWLLPLLLSYTTLTINFQSLYVGLVPFSMLLAILGQDSVHYFSEVLLSQPLSFALIVIFSIGFSPAIVNYNGWDCVSRFTNRFLKELSDSIPGNGAPEKLNRIEIKNYPNRFTFVQSFFHARSLDYPASHGIESWLRLRHGAEFSASVDLSYTRTPGCGDNFTLQKSSISNRLQTPKTMIFSLLWDSE